MGSGYVPYDRMLERVSGHGLEIDWNVPERRSPLSRLKPSAAQRGLVVDVSVGGARVLAPSDRALVNGVTLRIGAQGCTGTVRVRWSHPVDSGRTMFGLDYVQLPEALADYLLQPIAQARGEVPLTGWSPTF